MFKYTCLNPIADIGLNNLTDEYTNKDEMEYEEDGTNT